MNCDPIARWYARLEYLGFGSALERRRNAFLPKVADAKRILVLGEGDGRFLVKLVEQNVHASIDYVDLSAKMLELARARAGDDRVTYRQANALDVQLPENELDLIVTHFFLDCLNEKQARALVASLTLAARPRAQWLISEFRGRSSWARVIVRLLYLFFRMTTGLRANRLIDHHSMLLKNGWRLEREETERFGLVASELWRYLP